MSQLLAGWLSASYLAWTMFAVGAPVVADKLPKSRHTVEYNCPSPRALHGVGGQQGKTYVRLYDECSPNNKGVRIYKK